jgi:hypothetical protein
VPAVGIAITDAECDPDEWLTPREAAAIAKLSERTLANRRSLHTGPPYIKLSGGISGRVRYSRNALVAWLTGEQPEVAN